MSIRTDAILAALLVSAMTVPAPAQALKGRAASAAAPVAAACTDGQGPTSAFICAPLINNESVRACATNPKGAALTQCQQTAATNFCRTRSYGAAAAYQVTANGNLSEVLCRAPMVASAAGAGAMPSAPAPAQGPTALGNVYATIDWGDLTVTEWGPTTFGATYTHDDEGKIRGQRNGLEIKGIWSQSTSGQRCNTRVGNTYYHGRMTFVFDADLDAFSGLWGYCESEPDQTWNGNLTSRSSASANASSARTGAAIAPAQTTTGSASGEKGKKKTPSGQETVADRLAREAADEAERAAADKVRRGVRDVIKGKLPF